MVTIAITGLYVRYDATMVVAPERLFAVTFPVKSTVAMLGETDLQRACAMGVTWPFGCCRPRVSWYVCPGPVRTTDWSDVKTRWPRTRGVAVGEGEGLGVPVGVAVGDGLGVGVAFAFSLGVPERRIIHRLFADQLENHRYTGREVNIDEQAGHRK
jgi:hypothetical protein